ncbi:MULTISPECIES: hypothetical protein [Oceanobacillus]|uniref:DUF4293 family protein n=1 Tax=Oceanobacillus kimchii TaxID=746691 RepID=A0ABQ5TK20_9BACI|nr:MULTISPECIES: hypothetical protein [Oceanobacillus]MBT2652896.1 hypothetical protein [Oceanobacillus sp. ISL-73]OEH53641.1 hypothetical protein AQ616_14205 [Oceanobacillus sp. E9]GLO64842.1 hypothetical protein MACH08_06260 [Oceanobacillus kimchii]
MKRLHTTILSIILFSTLYSWAFYIPVSQRAPNTYYFGFWETFIFVFMFSIPPFIAGAIISMVIDMVIKRINISSNFAHYLLQLILYSLAACIIISVLFVFDDGPFDIREFMIFVLFGIIAANIYLHILLALNKIHVLLLNRYSK